MNFCESVLDLVGDTPLVRLNNIVEPGMATVLAKMETLNPTGSVKDRMAINMVKRAEEEGLLKPGGTLVESTSGNTGLGLAMAAAAKGYRCIFTIPDKMSQEKIDMLKALSLIHRAGSSSSRQLRGSCQTNRGTDTKRLLHRPVQQHVKPGGPLFNHGARSLGGDRRVDRFFRRRPGHRRHDLRYRQIPQGKSHGGRTGSPSSRTRSLR